LIKLIWGVCFRVHGEHIFEKKQAEMGLVSSVPVVPGIPNLGNTCYLNALLQALAACPTFVRFMRVHGKKSKSRKINEELKPFDAGHGDDPFFRSDNCTKDLNTDFINLFSDLLRQLSVPNVKNVAVVTKISKFLQNIKKNLQSKKSSFLVNEQQDSLELLHLFYDMLELRLRYENYSGLSKARQPIKKGTTLAEVQKKLSKENIPISFKLIDKRVCQRCQTRANIDLKSVGKSCHLSLYPSTERKMGENFLYHSSFSPPTNDINAYLSEYFREEMLEGVECTSVACDFLESFGFPKPNSSKQLLLASCPQVLCLHIQRLQYFGAKGVQKDSSRFPIEKHIYINSEWIFDERKGEGNAYAPPLKYDLKSIIVHSQLTPTVGHYTTYRKSPSKNGEGDSEVWLLANDSIVVEVDWDTEVSRCEAYMLFYEKCV
jgi:ubiquitin C-terminal hydrolase